MKLRWIALLCCWGCPSGGAELRVDLRSDWVAGVEVAEVITTVADLEESTPFNAGEDLAAGVRVGQFGSVPSGTQRVRLALRGPAGNLVAERTVVVQVRGSTGITLLVTRNCEGVTCDDPAANQCLDGRCVSERCSVENIVECGMPSCTAPVECIATAACVEPECTGGACLQRGGACELGEYCDPETGCRPIPTDAGTDAAVDGGVDATFDAGVDAPADAGTDAFDGGVDANRDAGVACSVHEPDDSASQALMIGVEGTIDDNDVITSSPLRLCAGDADWIAVETIGLVRSMVTLTGVAPSTSMVCLEVFTYSDLADVGMDPPTLEQGPVCATFEVGDFISLGPVNGTLFGGGNYIVARVSFSDERDEPVYTVRFDGMPAF